MIRLALEQAVLGESSHIVVRAKLRAIARRLRFGEIHRERMELVCTEMLTNQFKHAAGTGLIQIWESDFPVPAIDLFAVDYGPGIDNVERAATDGYTTARTMGHGIGAVQRLADASDIYSLRDNGRNDMLWHGTAVWARFRREPEPAYCQWRVGVFLRAYQDGLHNGDNVWVQRSDTGFDWLHMDGLGHGAAAAEAVTGMGRVLEAGGGPAAVLDRVSRMLRGRRGAVGIAAQFDAAQGRVRLCGVGDMTAAVLAAGDRQLLSFSPGVLGHLHRRFDTIERELSCRQTVLTASDGLRRSWGATGFPGLERLHPQMAVLILGNLAGRVNDDKSLFAVQLKCEGDGNDR